MINRLNTELINAVYSNNYDMVNLLIKLGADVNNSHTLSLRIANKYRFENIMKVLLNNGADYKDVENYLLSVDNYKDSEFLIDFVNNLKNKGDNK